jgi:DNA modification methylase
MRGPDMATHYYKKSGIALYRGDSREVLRTFPDSSIDAIICDPPYPCIVREYGRLTEAEWHDLMRAVVAECRRILKPRGSAVFILQPNSERVGRMRPWLFEFQAWACREWNMIQDAWWWKIDALPLTKNDPNRLRSSVKACVWLGESDCHRNISEIRWAESDHNLSRRANGRCLGKFDRNHQTRVNVDYGRSRSAVEANGGTTPFNLIPIGGDGKKGGNPHPSRTPEPLMDWWVRYISPPDGVVCDPFMGSGTTGLAALKRGRSFIGIESFPKYCAIAEKRIDDARP